MSPSAALLMDRCRDRPQGTTAIDSFREKIIIKALLFLMEAFSLLVSIQGILHFFFLKLTLKFWLWTDLSNKQPRQGSKTGLLYATAQLFWL